MRRETLIRHVLTTLIREGDRLMATATDLQAAVDALKTQVTRVTAEIAELKAQVVPAPPPLIDQAQLDATTADLASAAETLQGL